MNRKTGFWLAIALLSIGALGVSAATLESTLTTEPDDVIDPDYESVPIGQGDAQRILDEMNRADDEASEAGDSGGGESSESSSDANGGAADATVPSDPSLLDRLLDVLAALLPYLSVIAALGGAVALFRRYREELLALLDGSRTTDSDGAAPTSDDLFDGTPANAVDRTWAELIRHLDADRPATMTPNECAAAAVESGFDREAVRTITRTFEEVRYGGLPATERRERLARRCRRELGLEGER